MDKIGIIIPVYNVEKYLQRCIDSILSQTENNFLLISVDDGSTDSSGDILEQYASKDSRIIVRHTENGGHAAARNVGLDIAFTIPEIKWVTFIDSDDWIDKNYLKFLVDTAKNLSCDIVVGDYDRVYDVNHVAVVPKSIGDTVEYVSTEDFWCTKRITATIPCGKLFCKSLFCNNRFPNKVHDDEHFTYKLLFSRDKIAYINHPIYHYYYNINSVMSSGWSPKHLDSIDAIQERRQFFVSKGHIKAAELDNRLLVAEIYDSILELEKFGKEYSEKINEFKELLYDELKHNKDFGFNTHSYMWIKARPIYKLKYYYRALKNKFFRVICQK